MQGSDRTRERHWEAKLAVTFALVLGMATVCQFFCVVPYVLYHEVGRTQELQKERLAGLVRFVEPQFLEQIRILEDEVQALDPVTVARASAENPVVIPLPEPCGQAVMLIKQDSTTARIVPGPGDGYERELNRILPELCAGFKSSNAYLVALPANSRTGLSPDVCACAIPWPHGSEKPVALVVFLFKLRRFSEVLRNWPMVPGEWAYMVDGNGHLLAHSLIDLAALRSGSLVLGKPGQLKIPDFTRQKQTENVIALYGEGNLLGAAVTLRGSNTAFALEMPRKAAAKGTSEMLWQLLLIDCGIFLAALATSVIFMRGVTVERNGYEERLSKSEARYRSVFENIRDLYFEVDQRGSFLEISPSAEEMTGRSLADLRTMRLHDLCLNREDGNRLLAAIAEKGHVEDTELLLQCRDGSAKFCSVNATQTNPSTAISTMTVCGTIRDISARKQIEEERRRSAETAGALLNASFDAALLISRDYTVIAANQAAAVILDCSPKDLVGRGMDGLFPTDILPSCREILQSVFRYGKAVILENQANSRCLAFRAQPVLDASGYVISAALFIRDITEQRTFERHLSHTAKMEALGQLAGGIAHDFNNLLTGIVGYADVLSRKLVETPHLLHYAERLLSASQRASELNRQLLSFARKDDARLRSMNVHTLIEEAISLARHGVGRRVLVKQQLEANQDVVTGDPVEIQNALLNIVINAHEAMTEGGTLFIQTDNLWIDEGNRPAGFEKVKPGQHLRIRIEDTGKGMPPEVLARIFEPFFTTKQNGSGLGLGLASTYVTVTAHGGAIWAETRLGQGTAFTILLPSTDEKTETSTGISSPPVDGDGRQVLVIDDEEIILEMIRDILGSFGYQVLACHSGAEAIALYRACWRDVDIVLLDLVMPGLDGKQTLESLRQINPGVRVLVATGMAHAHDVSDVDSANVVEVVLKPFSPADLCAAITRHLGG